MTPSSSLRLSNASADEVELPRALVMNLLITQSAKDTPAAIAAPVFVLDSF